MITSDQQVCILPDLPDEKRNNFVNEERNDEFETSIHMCTAYLDDYPFCRNLSTGMGR